MYCSAEVEAKEAEAKRAREAAEAKAKEEEAKFGYWQQEFGCWKGMLMRIFGIALVWLILQFDVIPLTLEFAKRYWPFFYFSPIFLAIFLDYRWAYEDEAHGLWPKFSFPKSKADGCMALVGLFLKGLLLTSGFFPIMFMRIAEGILFVGQYTLILVCWAIIVISIWTPTLFSKQCPTMKNLCQQYHVERSTGLDFTADIRQNCKYLKENCKTLAAGICRVPLLLCNPLLCVTTLKAAVLLYLLNIFGTFFLLCYFSFRVGVAAYTYKLFTFVGWSDELVYMMKMKKRFTSLDYPMFWTAQKLQDRKNCRDYAVKSKDGEVLKVLEFRKRFRQVFTPEEIAVVLQGSPSKRQVLQFLKDNSRVKEIPVCVSDSLQYSADEFGAASKEGTTKIAESWGKALTNGCFWDSVQVQGNENGAAETMFIKNVERIDLSWDAVVVEKEGEREILQACDLTGFGKLSDLEEEKAAKDAIEQDKEEGQEIQETDNIEAATIEEKWRKQKEGQKEAKEKVETAYKTGFLVLMLPLLLDIAIMVLELLFEFFGDVILHVLFLAVCVLMSEKVRLGARTLLGISLPTFPVQVPVDATPGQIIQATAPSGMLVYVQIPDKIRGGMVIFVEDPGQPKDQICDRV